MAYLLALERQIYETLEVQNKFELKKQALTTIKFLDFAVFIKLIYTMTTAFS